MYKISKAEILRPLVVTAQHTKDSITNLRELGDFSDTDLKFMEEFKRIFELGIPQFTKFVSLLDSEGSSLEEQSIVYYVTQLKNSPFRELTKQLTGTYWQQTSDAIGVLRNAGTQFPDTLPSTTQNKLPKAMVDSRAQLQLSLTQMDIIKGTQLTQVDNTLPCASKGNANRSGDELTGGTNTLPHGGYKYNDIETSRTIDANRQNIDDSVRTYLRPEDYRIYSSKTDSPTFNRPDKIESKVVDHKIEYNEVTYTDKGETKVNRKETTIQTDLAGNLFETDADRNTSIIINGKDKDTTIKLHTVDGQLGSNVIPRPRSQNQ